MGQRELDQQQPIGQPAKGCGQRAEGLAHAEIHLENHHANADGKQAMAQQPVNSGDAPAISSLHLKASRSGGVFKFRLEPVGRKRQAPQPRAGRIEHGIGNGGTGWPLGRLSGA